MRCGGDREGVRTSEIIRNDATKTPDWLLLSELLWESGNLIVDMDFKTCHD